MPPRSALDKDHSPRWISISPHKLPSRQRTVRLRIATLRGGVATQGNYVLGRRLYPVTERTDSSLGKCLIPDAIIAIHHANTL